MRMFDKEQFLAIYKTATIDELKSALLCNSYEYYKAHGGVKSPYQLYYAIKQRGKSLESSYIQMCDMYCSDISINEELMAYKRALAQMNYIALATIFDEPLRVVSYNTFYLEDFNNF